MHKQTGRRSLLLTCACDLARELERCAVDQRWLLDDEGEGMTDLLGALTEARRPFDERKERQAAKRHEEGEERERLRSDPEASPSASGRSCAGAGEKIALAERQPMLCCSLSKARAG
jgi:hypothetical protein